MAKRIGLPMAQFVAATNVNDAVPPYLRTGRYEPRASVRTVANAMDVGAPSNFERMQAMYGGDRRRAAAGRRRASPSRTRRSSTAIGDVSPAPRLRAGPARRHRLAGHQRRAGGRRPEAQGVFLATAHPAKFREVVEPAIGRPVPLPPTRWPTRWSARATRCPCPPTTRRFTYAASRN